MNNAKMLTAQHSTAQHSGITLSISTNLKYRTGALYLAGCRGECACLRK